MNLSLVKRQTRSIRNLAGFQKKNHRVPDHADDRAEQFVAEITQEEIKEDLSQVFQRLRKEFGLRRTEMKVANEHGTGAIDTPYFQYSVVVFVNPDEPKEVIWQRQVTDIRDRIQVLSVPFERVFSSLFDTVEFFPSTEIDIDEVIDRIEDLEDDRITLDYDMDATQCSIEIEGVVGQVEIHPSTVLFTQNLEASAKDLLQSFLEMQEMMSRLRVT